MIGDKVGKNLDYVYKGLLIFVSASFYIVLYTIFYVDWLTLEYLIYGSIGVFNPLLLVTLCNFYLKSNNWYPIHLLSPDQMRKFILVSGGNFIFAVLLFDLGLALRYDVEYIELVGYLVFALIVVSIVGFIIFYWAKYIENETQGESRIYRAKNEEIISAVRYVLKDDGIKFTHTEKEKTFSNPGRDKFELEEGLKIKVTGKKVTMSGLESQNTEFVDVLQTKLDEKILDLKRSEST